MHLNSFKINEILVHILFALNWFIPFTRALHNVIFFRRGKEWVERRGRREPGSGMQITEGDIGFATAKKKKKNRSKFVSCNK